MASISIGLTIPGQPPTPSDGRAQHYARPGVPDDQPTRTFPNGTTIKFGPNDHIPSFNPGDPFFEQVLVIEAATADINAAREHYRLFGPNYRPQIQGPFGHSAYFGLIGATNPIQAFDNGPFHDRGFSIASATSTYFQSEINFGTNYSEYGGAKLPSVAENGQPNQNTFGGLQHNPRLPGSTANVYQSQNRSTQPGFNHPGFSTDTRFGIGKKPFSPSRRTNARQAAIYRQNKDRIQAYRSIKGPRGRPRGRYAMRDFGPQFGPARFGQSQTTGEQISLATTTNMEVRMMQDMQGLALGGMVPPPSEVPYQSQPKPSLPPLPKVGSSVPLSFGSRPDRKFQKKPTRLSPTWLGEPPKMAPLISKSSDVASGFQNNGGTVQSGSFESPAVGMEKPGRISHLRKARDEWQVHFNAIDSEDRYRMLSHLWNIEASIIIIENYDNNGELRGYEGFRVNPDRPTKMPGITDLPGPLCRYSPLLARNINPVFNATDMEPNGHEVFNRQTEERHADLKFIKQVAFLGPLDNEEEVLPRYRRSQVQVPRASHVRQASENTSVFFNEFNFASPQKSVPTQAQYIGYSIAGGPMRERSRPTTPKLIRSRTGLFGNLADAQSRISSPGRNDLLGSRVATPIRPRSTGILGRYH